LDIPHFEDAHDEPPSFDQDWEPEPEDLLAVEESRHFDALTHVEIAADRRGLKLPTRVAEALATKLAELVVEGSGDCDVDVDEDGNLFGGFVFGPKADLLVGLYARGSRPVMLAARPPVVRRNVSRARRVTRRRRANARSPGRPAGGDSDPPPRRSRTPLTRRLSTISAHEARLGVPALEESLGRALVRCRRLDRQTRTSSTAPTKGTYEGPAQAM
jgi:hypothetical protein